MAAASNLLAYLKNYIGQPADVTLGTEDDAACMTAANAALMELLGDGTRRREQRKELVRAPASVTLGQVTADSKDLTFSGFQSYMTGCSIFIGSTWNRLVTLTSGTVSLESPYEGSTASNVAATVYFDAILLDAALEPIGQPILWNDTDFVQLVPNNATLTAMSRMRQQMPTPPMGQPAFVLQEDALSINATPATRLMFESLPTTKGILSFNATLRPPQIASWSDTTPSFLGGARDGLVLYPVARFYLSSYAQFIGDRGEAQTDLTNARTQWQAYSGSGNTAGTLDLYGT